MPPTKRRTRRRGPQPRFYLFMMAAAVLVGAGIHQAMGRFQPGSGLTVVSPSPLVEATAARVDHSAELFAHTARVQQAIETFAKEHGGRVPVDAAAFDLEIVRGGYLGTQALPDSPWGGRRTAMLAPTPEVRANAGLGVAQVAVEVTAPHHLGALCYESLGTRRYRIYGIGLAKDGQAAVIVKLGTMVP